MSPLIFPLPHLFARVVIADQVLFYLSPTNAKVGRWDLDSDFKKTITFIPFYYPIYYTNSPSVFCILFLE
jgi:hypothetical protein